MQKTWKNARQSMLATVLLAALSACASSAAVQNQNLQLQTLDQRTQTVEARAQQIEARAQEIEKKLGNDRLFALLNEVERLKSDVAQLRGELELQQHSLQSMQKRQLDLFADADTRLAELEKAAKSPKNPETSANMTANAAKNSPSLTAPNAAKSLAAAQDLLRARDFSAAIAALKAHIRDFPADKNHAEAHYWLGVAHTAAQQWREAIAAHEQFMKLDNEHARVPDAMRALGSNYLQIQDKKAADAVWDKLLRRFPKSDAAAKVRAARGA